MQPQKLIVFALVGVVVVGLLAWRMRRMMRATPFDPYRAWMLPVLFIVLSGLNLYRAGPVGMDWAWVAGAAALGAVIGYFRGRSIQISLDPTTGGLTAQGSAAAMIFILVLLVVRFALLYVLQSNANGLSLRPIMADVLLSVLGAGAFVARGAEMGLRGHRLLEAHRANPTATSTATIEAP